MPDADPIPRRFGLRPDVLRAQRRILSRALAWYLPGAVALTAAAVWPEAGAGRTAARALIALGAAQVDYYAYVVVAQVRLNRRDLRLAGAPAGDLVLDGAGVRAGSRQLRWTDVTAVRVRRRGVPHVAVIARRRGLRRPTLAVRGGYYGASLDELAAVFERYAPVSDAGRPREPASDEAAGTVTFFFNDGVLRAQRGRHLRSLWRLPLMLGPAIAGLAALGRPGGPLAAGALAALLGALLIIQRAKAARLSRLLRISRDGMGRLLLAPGYLTLAGTSVPIPWSHVQGAAVARDSRPGLNATVRCPDPDPSPGCKFRGRTIGVHVAESLYYTTADDIGAAFSRFTQVEM
jgi:hypothetical protein